MFGFPVNRDFFACKKRSQLTGIHCIFLTCEYGGGVVLGIVGAESLPAEFVFWPEVGSLVFFFVLQYLVVVLLVV